MRFPIRLIEFYSLFGGVESTIARGKKNQRLYGIENQKLDTWARKLGIKFNHHSALDDAEVCMQVYKYQKEKNESNLQSNNAKSIFL